MKIVAFASAGGHWVELMRLKPIFENQDVVYVSTKESFAETVQGQSFFCVPDFNRWNKFQVLKGLLTIYNIIRKIKPDLIISTGAAPGLIAILSGKILGVKTIWIDCISQVEELSLSGRMAIRIADKTYTQWPNLASCNVFYCGSTLS